MLSEEEKEESYWKGYIAKQNEAMEICKQCKYIKKTRELESDKQKLIEKLEERRKQNKEEYDETLYNAHIEEMNELKGQILEDNYILRILKGEKE